MNILVLADLHYSNSDWNNVYKLRRVLEAQTPIQTSDLVLICGDVFENTIRKTKFNPLELLYSLFQKEVIFCLGNHEFAYQDYNNVLTYWKQFKHEHVHCLDVEGKAEFNGINFVGNVFWYDFTLGINRWVMQGEILNGWLDSTIQNFDPIQANLDCQKQILDNLSNTLPNILITHTVPHEKLNWFNFNDPNSPYNYYSGNKDFLKNLQNKNFLYSFSGHTHKRMTDEIYNIPCVNIGNDYYFKTETVNYYSFTL